MNILTDALPTELKICGKTCPIKSDFRTWIKVSALMSNHNIDEISALTESLKLVFFKLPPKLSDAIGAILEFYNPKKIQNTGGGEVSKKRIYDFSYDAELIYAAFLQQYKLDLCREELHWWQFKTLFDNLTEETQFIKVVGYRSIKLEKIKDKEQRKFYRKMKELYKLPDNRTQEERERDMVKAFEASFV